MTPQQCNLLNDALNEQSADSLALPAHKIIRAYRRRDNVVAAPPFRWGEILNASQALSMMNVRIVEAASRPGQAHPQKALLELGETRSSRSTTLSAIITYWEMPNEIEKEFILIKELAHIIIRTAFYKASPELGEAWSTLMRQKPHELFRALALRPKLLEPQPDGMTVEQTIFWRLEHRAFEVAAMLRVPRAIINETRDIATARSMDRTFVANLPKVLGQTAWLLPPDVVEAILARSFLP